MKYPDNVELDAETEKFAQDLRRRFVHVNEDMPGDDFAQQVTARVQRQTSVREVWRLVLLCVLAGIIAISAPLLIDASIALGQLTENFYVDLDALLISPMSWAMALLLAVWALRRTRVV